jgi:hypothetical protein
MYSPVKVSDFIHEAICIIEYASQQETRRARWTVVNALAAEDFDLVKDGLYFEELGMKIISEVMSYNGQNKLMRLDDGS